MTDEAIKEWAKRQAIGAYVEQHADKLVQEVLIDMVEYDLCQNPTKAMGESASECAIRLRGKLTLLCDCH
jgi:hypothetical protein